MFRDEIDFRRAEHINEAARRRITKGIGAPGDIIFSHKGTVGKLARAREDSPPFVCSPQTTFWRAIDKQRLDARFLYAFMRSKAFKLQWAARKGETDMADYVSLTAQRRLLIPLPDIKEQQVIGDVLQPIEDQILENRRLGKSVHDLAERLFRSWFVDFDLFSGNGALAGETELYRRLRALARVDASVTGLRRPPDGWTQLSLNKIAHYQNGIAMQRFPPTDDGGFLPVLKIAQLRDGSIENADQVTDKLSNKVIVENGDVVFSWSGSLLVRIWCGGRAGLNQHLFKVTSNQFPRWFYYFWTRVHLSDFRAIAADKRTTMGHIKRNHLSDALTWVPDSRFIEAVDEVLAPMLERSIVCELQSRRLEALRDFVVRALMSGEVALDWQTTVLETVV
jgi:type I restriction enzyme S subunit